MSEGTDEMARVYIEGENLVVAIEGLDKLWTLRSHLEIPLSHVRGATIDPDIINDPKGFPAPGEFFPGVVVTGTYYLEGERIFWDIHDPNKSVVIELADERFSRLVIGVDDPQATVNLI